jgi:hypothetical protein
MNDVFSQLGLLYFHGSVREEMCGHVAATSLGAKNKDCNQPVDFEALAIPLYRQILEMTHLYMPKDLLFDGAMKAATPMTTATYRINKSTSNKTLSNSASVASDISDSKVMDATVKASRVTCYYANIHTAGGVVHYFQWTSEHEYLDFMRQISSAQQGKNVSLKQQIHAHYPPYRDTLLHTAWASPASDIPEKHKRHLLATYPTQLQISSADGNLVWGIDFQASEVNMATEKQNRKCEYQVYLCDIECIVTENAHDFSKRYLLEVSVSDIVSDIDFSRTDALLVTLTSPHGDESYCKFHNQDLDKSYENGGGIDSSTPGNKTSMQLFVSGDDIMKNTSIRVGVFIVSAGSFGMDNGSVKCLSESIVSLSQLIKEAYAYPPVIVSTTSGDHGNCYGDDEDHEGDEESVRSHSMVSTALSSVLSKSGSNHDY